MAIDAQRLQELDDALAEVRRECIKAMHKFAPFNSAHEGHSVLREEVEELWDEVKADRGYADRARVEARQGAAMAIRYMVDLCPLAKGGDRG
jgi:hypothetical protein